MAMDTMTRTAAGQPLDVDETHRLISSEKVDGTAVYNPNGDRLGTVHHLMIDKYMGRVDYAVMSFGGVPRHRRELSSAAVAHDDLRHPP